MVVSSRARAAAAAAWAGLLTVAATGCGGGGGGGGPNTNIEVAIDVAAADFNGDGRPDVALPVDKGVNTPGEVAVYSHAGVAGSGYGSRTNYTAGIGALDRIVAADLNGDGRPDLIVSSQMSSSVAVLLNNAANPGSFGAPQTLSAPNVTDVAVANLTGSGQAALVIAGSTLMVALQNSASPGTFAAPATLYTGNGGFVAVAAGDLDGDGNPDLAVADETGVTVLLLVPGAATPTVAGSTRVYSNPAPPANTGLNAVAIADVDGDGRNDLVIVDPANSVVAISIQSHTTAGQFLPAVTYPLPTNGGLDRFTVKPLGGGAQPPDIVIAASSSVLVYRNSLAQPGTFGAASSYPVPIGADGVSVVDVDGDGLPDIVTNSGATIPSFGTLPKPGVLLQDPANPGHFLAVKDLQTM